ncbi:MAG TPA: universal stress protein [Nitrososphaeraceae archaeon]
MSFIKARISKIVVPLDGSESAMDAADYALLIAKQSNAELIAIHAARTQDVRYQLTNMLIEDIETPTTADSVLQRIKDDAHRWTNAIKQKSSANGIRLRTALVIDSTEIADTIVHYTERENADLIVIGGGKTGLKERILGSTTSKVVAQTKRPILIVK